VTASGTLRLAVEQPSLDRRTFVRGGVTAGDPLPGIGTASSGDAVAFLRQRTALYGKVGTGLLAAVFLALNAIYLVHPPHDGDAHGLVNRFHVAGIGIAALAWFVASRARFGARGLRSLEAATTLVLAALVAGMASALPANSHPHMVAIVGVTNLLATRAVIVPSRATSSVVVGILAALPPLAVAAFRTAPAPPLSQLVIVLFAVTWLGVATAVTAITSSVIFGLRRRVHEAMRLGQYTLGDKVGQGGMGIVYKATHSMLRRPTAVKLLLPERSADVDLARFEQEVQLTALLTHPNTVAIFDYGRTPEGIFYYAMEYLDGLALDEVVMRGGPMSPGRVIHVLRQVCGALAEAHAAGLVHRDIKPSNIVLCKRGGVSDVAKVVDFGLVKNRAAGADAQTSAPDAVAGTPQYLSPEAIRTPQRVDGRSDLYAVGCVAYFLLCGRDVFEAETVVEICSEHLTAIPERPSRKLGAPLPADIEDVVLRCLEKDPAQRLQTAAALEGALAACDDADTWTSDQALAWWSLHGAAADHASSLAHAPTIPLNDGSAT
jgi:serine/threonine-protein kinase